MGTEKTTAIILRVIDFSETSCIVTMLTRDFGKITALAKGARRPKSPFEAALDVLAMVRIVFLHKSSDAMDLLTEAKLERRFRNRSGDLDSLYAAYYVVELLRGMTEEVDPHPELFDLAESAISVIDGEILSGKLPAIDQPVSIESNPTQQKRKNDELNICLLRFEVGLLKILGHLPLLTKCVECGRERTTQNRVSFGLQAGGVLCRQCRAGHSHVIQLSDDAVELLLKLSGQKKINSKNRIERPLTNKTTESESNLPSLPSSDRDTLIELRKLMNKYISHLLGFEPRLHKFLRKLEA